MQRLRTKKRILNVAFKYLVSEFYSRDLSIKYKSAKYVKFRRGEYQSKLCPYGYKKGADGRMELNEETAPNVRLIFELAREGYGPGEIGKTLFERGIPTPGEYKAKQGIASHDVSRCNGVWPTCHGLMVMEVELEGMLYEVLSKQAQVILNVADLSNAGRLDVQLAEQAEYDKQIEIYLDQKRVLYEQLILKQITMEDYKIQKAAVDGELDRLREIHSKLKLQTSQMEMDEKTKSARTKLAREVVGAGGLTVGLADMLIDRVYVYPNNQVEIVWKMKDFCME